MMKIIIYFHLDPDTRGCLSLLTILGHTFYFSEFSTVLSTTQVLNQCSLILKTSHMLFQQNLGTNLFLNIFNCILWKCDSHCPLVTCPLIYGMCIDANLGCSCTNVDNVLLHATLAEVVLDKCANYKFHLNEIRPQIAV